MSNSKIVSEDGNLVAKDAPSASDTTHGKNLTEVQIMTNPTQTRDEMARGLIEIGERAIAVEDDAALDAYFAGDFVFHGPGGWETDFEGLKSFFAAMRHAFSDFSVTRGHILVDGRWIASQTRMAGVFEREFTASPVGPLPPTGEEFVLDLQNIFRYDDSGKLAEEWVQYDLRGMLAQLGAAGR